MRTCRPLRPRGVHRLLLLSSSPMALAFAKNRLTRHSQLTRHPLQTRGEFRGFIGSLSLRPVHLLVPLADLTGHFTQPTGTFTPELSASWSPSSPSGITTVAPERFHRWDFHPLERQLASLQRFPSPLPNLFVFRQLQPQFLTKPAFLTIGPSVPASPSDSEQRCAVHHRRHGRKSPA